MQFAIRRIVFSFALIWLITRENKNDPHTSRSMLYGIEHCSTSSFRRRRLLVRDRICDDHDLLDHNDLDDVNHHDIHNNHDDNLFLHHNHDDVDDILRVR